MIFTILFVIIASAILAQPNLKPSIGVFNLPADSDSICSIPVYTGNYYDSGINEGETIADFTLYTLNGDTVNIKEELAKGKPILLVGGSYTCPVFRNKMPALNNIYNTFSNDLSIFIIYVVEAHPVVDPSPYSGNVWVTSQNQNQGVLYEQPKTYGERKAIIDIMLAQMNILSPILIDGTCNEWWSYFGPAPNNAYLIDTDGTVFSKHGWFHKQPDNMFCDIQELFGNPCGGNNQTNGEFEFALSNDNAASDVPGSILEIHGVIQNISSEAVEIDVIRKENNIPEDWGSAMCLDICLPEWVDSTYLYLDAGEKQTYIMYFYSDNTPDYGSTEIHFINRNDLTNYHIQDFHATTQPVSAYYNTISDRFSIYPNPANEYITYTLSDETQFEELTLTLTDVYGKEVKNILVHKPFKGFIEVSGLPAGVYVLGLLSKDGLLLNRKIILN